MSSERLTEPAPTLEVSEPVLSRLAGSMPFGSTFSRPKKLAMLASSELGREREVVFDSLAASATETLTVIPSPTRLARGSWKKLRAPGCHSELFSWLIGGVWGIAATIWLSAGLPT